METSEKTVTEALQAEIPGGAIAGGEPGRSLMALGKAQLSPRAGPMERNEEMPIRVGSDSQNLAVMELQSSIAKLLDLLTERQLHPEPQDISPKSLEPLARSLTEAFAELNQRIQESEARQSTTIEAALKQWEGERETKAAEHLIEIETMRMRSQSEVNRILRVMWLGTGVAAGCAVSALYLFRN